MKNAIKSRVTRFQWHLICEAMWGLGFWAFAWSMGWYGNGAPWWQSFFTWTAVWTLLTLFNWHVFEKNKEK